METEVNKDNCCEAFSHQNRKATHIRRNFIEGRPPVNMCFECYEIAKETSNLSVLLIGEIK